MQSPQLVELAALVAFHGPQLIAGPRDVAPASLQRYWSSSKCRLDRWAASLKTLSKSTVGKAVDGAVENGERNNASLTPLVMDEILTGEMLSRVWTAVLSAYDRSRATDLAEPIARSVLIGHVEARNRVLQLMLDAKVITRRQAGRLNKARRRGAHWTDLLVGYLAECYDVSEFAPDPQRARQFADDLRHQRQIASEHARPLVLASLRSAFPNASGRRGLVSPNADLNTRIASSILACFQTELFDTTGLEHSLCQMRLTNTADEAEDMLESLLNDATPSDDDRVADPF